jgi:3-oxoacyl-[acyl-carrier protein] reductase
MNDQIALVTGGGRGIGKAIALNLARKGCHLVLADLNQADLDETAAQVASLGREALTLINDVSVFDAARDAVARATERFGRVDILVNNAGVTRDNLLLRMKESDWDLVLAVNLKGAFNFCHAAAPGMMKRRFGRIVNISSVVGIMGNAGQANYAASKAGLVGLTKSLARELASRNITANAVAPGFIDTPMTQGLPEKAREALFAQIPLGRLGTAEDVAEAVAFLASPQASYITGQVLHVNGGMYT